LVLQYTLPGHLNNPTTSPSTPGSPPLLLCTEEDQSFNSTGTLDNGSDSIPLPGDARTGRDQSFKSFRNSELARVIEEIRKRDIDLLQWTDFHNTEMPIVSSKALNIKADLRIETGRSDGMRNSERTDNAEGKGHSNGVERLVTRSGL
jgi:hypothetical protein